VNNFSTRLSHGVIYNVTGNAKILATINTTET